MLDACLTVRIKPASRKIRKWLDSVDFAIFGQGAASAQDAQLPRFSYKNRTIRSRIGSANAPSTPSKVMSSRDGCIKFMGIILGIALANFNSSIILN